MGLNCVVHVDHREEDDVFDGQASYISIPVVHTQR